MNTNRRIKGPVLDVGECLQFIGICLFTTTSPGMKWVDYFRKTPTDIFGGYSISVNQFMSGNSFELSAMIPSSLLPLHFEVNFMKSHI